MPTDDRQILVAGTAHVPADFVVPGNGQIQPKAVRAVFDGSGAAGAFLPTLEIVSDAGVFVGQYTAPSVAAGASAAVSWFPDVAEQTQLLGGPPGFGCVRFVGPPSGVAAIDTASIQAAHDSLPTTGGIVQLCRGTYALAGDPALSLSKQIQLQGHGRFITSLVYGNSTGTAINVSAPQPFILRDFNLSYSGVTPTAGAGITVTGATTTYFQFVGLAVLGFYRCIDVQQGNSWTCSQTLVQDFVLSGIQVRNLTNADQGDFSLQDVHFFTGPNNVGATAGLEYRSAGGLKMNACKFNGPLPTNAGSVAILFAVADGAVTGDASIVNTSIENFAYGINLSSGSGLHTGQFSRITVAANEFLVSNTAISMAPGTAGQYSEIAISGNVISGGSFGIVLDNLDHVINGGNMFKFQSGAATSYGAGLTNHTTYANG